MARPAPVYTSCQSVVLFSPVHIDHPIHSAALFIQMGVPSHILTSPSPAPPARAVPEIFFNPENIFESYSSTAIVLRDETCAANDRCDGDGRPLRCGKIFFVEDENNFSLLVVSSAETGDRCVSAPRKMIDGGGDLTFKLKHLSLVSATSFLYILHKLWSGMKHPQLILESYKA